MHPVPPSDWQPPDPWERLADGQDLEHELDREMCKTHPLRSLAPRAVARRTDCDDVLFALNDGRLAVVHLTWNHEVDPAWPYVEYVADWADVTSELQT